MESLAVPFWAHKEGILSNWMEAFCLNLVTHGLVSIKTELWLAVAVAQAQALVSKISFRVLLHFKVHRIQETQFRCFEILII